MFLLIIVEIVVFGTLLNLGEQSKLINFAKSIGKNRGTGAKFQHQGIFSAAYCKGNKE